MHLPERIHEACRQLHSLQRHECCHLAESKTIHCHLVNYHYHVGNACSLVWTLWSKACQQQLIGQVSVHPGEENLMDLFFFSLHARWSRVRIAASAHEHSWVAAPPHTTTSSFPSSLYQCTSIQRAHSPSPALLRKLRYAYTRTNQVKWHFHPIPTKTWESVVDGSAMQKRVNIEGRGGGMISRQDQARARYGGKEIGSRPKTIYAHGAHFALRTPPKWQGNRTPWPEINPKWHFPSCASEKLISDVRCSSLGIHQCPKRNFCVYVWKTPKDRLSQPEEDLIPGWREWRGERKERITWQPLSRT